MKKLITILGILVTITILLSGTAIAGFAAQIVAYSNCTNRYEILDEPDDVHATIGVNPSTTGWIIVDLGSDNLLRNNQAFTVYADSVEVEDYSVYLWIYEDYPSGSPTFIDYGQDDADEVFYAPSTPDTAWRLVEIRGESGNINIYEDPIYGPEIDAIGT